MPKKKKESVNYLDQIPRISVPKWEVLEDGLVEVTVENKGFQCDRTEMFSPPANQLH